MPRQTLKGEVAVEYLRKHKDVPLLALAKLMHKEQPKLFTSVENTRKLLRSYTRPKSKGCGNVDVEKYGVVRERDGKQSDHTWEHLIPPSWEEGPKEWQMPRSIKKCLVLSDIHIPFHSVHALKIAIAHGVAEKPDALLLNGDTMDFYATSDHEKDPRKVNWLAEIESGRMLMEMLRKALPNIPIYFKSGNHEFRLERHLMKYAQILLGMPEFELPSLLHFGEYGIEHIRNKTNIFAGKLNVIHGDEYRGAGGVNPARWLSLRTGEPTICGHFHRTSAHMDRTIRHDIRGWWSTGCLCELSPDYLPYNQWNHGFAMVHIGSDGLFEVDNLIIVDGKVR